MDWFHALGLILAGYVTLLALRVPVFFAFLLVVLVASVAVFPGEIGLVVLARNVVDGLVSFVLLPIPLFLLIGNLYVESGAGGRAVGAVNRRIEKVRGRPGFVALGSGTLLSMVSGSSLASASLIMRTLAPIHQSERRRLRGITGAALSSGGIAIFIPPSALAVLVASVANVKVSDMLIAIIPMAATMICAYSLVIIATETPADTPQDIKSSGSGPLGPHIARLGGFFSVMMLSILLDLATPTEAAALGVASTTIMLRLTGELSLQSIRCALMQTAMDSASLLLIVAMAGLFSQVFVFLGVTNGVTALLSSLGDNLFVMLGVSVAAALLLGCFLDGVSITLICVPLFLPTLVEHGLSPLLFCLALLLCIETGLLTPPFGLLIILASGLLAGKLKASEIVRSTMPFVLANVMILAGLCLFATMVSI